MTITAEPWLHPDPLRSTLQLEKVPAPVVRALAGGGLGGGATPGNAPAAFAGEEWAGLWRLRSAQIEADPTDADWVTRFVIAPGIPDPVGIAGFHGRPNADGMVEIGYAIEPVHRRRGYATLALETLIAVASGHPDARTIRATIGPDNAASLALVQRYGFEEAGTQWDDEDGLELVFERAAR